MRALEQWQWKEPESKCQNMQCLMSIPSYVQIFWISVSELQYFACPCQNCKRIEQC